MNKPPEIVIEVYHPGDVSAGIFGYANYVRVSLDYDPGGEEGEFSEFVKGCLSDWFDGATVTVMEEK